MVPISLNQDTVGPMVRSVADAAAIMTVIAGRDLLDNFTFAQPEKVPDYMQALRHDALQGVRLGVPRLFMPEDKNIVAAFNASLDVIRRLGATVVDPAEFLDAAELLMSNNETIVMHTDFKVIPVWVRYGDMNSSYNCGMPVHLDRSTLKTTSLDC